MNDLIIETTVPLEPAADLIQLDFLPFRRERALVVMFRTQEGHTYAYDGLLLAVDGECISADLDNYGNSAREIGLLDKPEGLPGFPFGLFVWEGIPHDDGTSSFELRFEYDRGAWRAPTEEEWAVIKAAHIDELWGKEE